MELSCFKDFRDKVVDSVSRVIVGKDDKIEKVVVAFICGGHVLIEDVPGLGKTKLSNALAKSMDCSFKRVQFTPDLLPSDLTGIYFYNQKSQEFQFRGGPLLSNIVLADEINRATPRTQSALLECMEESQITVEGETVKLPQPFFVIATQNPVEQYGTFPLPEAQMDRFFMRISMGYPEYLEEKTILDIHIDCDPLEAISKVVSKEDIMKVRQGYREVFVSEAIKDYILNIVRSTRENNEVLLGVSPRGSLALFKASQALAAISGRDYVTCEDVLEMSVPVLAHRITLKSSVDNSTKENEAFIQKIVKEINTPLEEVK